MPSSHGVHRLGEPSVSVQGRPGLLNPAGQRELRRRHDNVRHVTGGQDALDGGLAREVGHAVSAAVRPRPRRTAPSVLRTQIGLRIKDCRVEELRAGDPDVARSWDDATVRDYASVANAIMTAGASPRWTIPTI